MSKHNFFRVTVLIAAALAVSGCGVFKRGRPKTPVIYSNDEVFKIGGLKVLRESSSDIATVIGARE